MNPRLTLMTVNGHPDDETVTAGGVMARYAAEGLRVVCVIATRGEAGEIVTADLDIAENHTSLGTIREAEATRALARLGTIELRLLGFRDSGTMGTADNADPRSFWQADFDAAAGRLVRIVREVRPHVIVAPNAYGGDGHPDHIRASQIAAAAFDRAGDATCYPDQLVGDGLEPWHPLKLYEVVDQFERRQKALRALRHGGLRGLASMTVRVLRHWTPAAERARARAAAATGAVTTRVDVSDFIEARLAALAEHRTQVAADGDRFALTAAERRQISPTEDFTLKARRVETRLPEEDLFAGLRDGDASPGRHG